MVRIMAAFAAWAAGTAVAVSVTWFGANVVIRNAGVGPGMPVINAAVLPTPAAASAPPGPPPVTVRAAAPAATSPAVTARARTGRATATAPASPASPSRSPSPSASASPSASQTPAGGVRAYTLAGGRVTLAVTSTSVQLVTAVPGDGYAVQTWSGTGWLRVDFSSGPLVSSLIASWYEHTPTITVEN
jgi:hypothetical protein